MGSQNCLSSVAFVIFIKLNESLLETWSREFLLTTLLHDVTFQWIIQNPEPESVMSWTTGQYDIDQVFGLQHNEQTCLFYFPYFVSKTTCMICLSLLKTLNYLRDLNESWCEHHDTRSPPYLCTSQFPTINNTNMEDWRNCEFRATLPLPLKF